ncbi:MAG: hypothetical protein U0798_19650 [Gemmataceae bacterium]
MNEPAKGMTLARNAGNKTDASADAKSVLNSCAMVFGQMNEPPGSSYAGGPLGLTMVPR